MDIQEIVGQFLGSVAENPDQLKKFDDNPEKTITEATGLSLSGDQLKDVIACIGPMIQGKELDMGAVMKIAGGFLQGDKGGNILDSLMGLFGGGSDEEKADSASNKDEGNPMDILSGLAGGLFGGEDDSKADNKSDKKDDANPLDIITGIAGGLFGGK